MDKKHPKVVRAIRLASKYVLHEENKLLKNVLASEVTIGDIETIVNSGLQIALSIKDESISDEKLKKIKNLTRELETKHESCALHLFHSLLTK